MLGQEETEDLGGNLRTVAGGMVPSLMQWAGFEPMQRRRPQVDLLAVLRATDAATTSLGPATSHLPGPSSIVGPVFHTSCPFLFTPYPCKFF